MELLYLKDLFTRLLRHELAPPGCGTETPQAQPLPTEQSSEGYSRGRLPKTLRQQPAITRFTAPQSLFKTATVPGSLPHSSSHPRVRRSWLNPAAASMRRKAGGAYEKALAGSTASARRSVSSSLADLSICTSSIRSVFVLSWYKVIIYVVLST